MIDLERTGTAGRGSPPPAGGDAARTPSRANGLAFRALLDAALADREGRAAAAPPPSDRAAADGSRGGEAASRAPTPGRGAATRFGSGAGGEATDRRDSPLSARGRLDAPPAGAASGRATGHVGDRHGRAADGTPARQASPSARNGEGTGIDGARATRPVTVSRAGKVGPSFALEPLGAARVGHDGQPSGRDPASRGSAAAPRSPGAYRPSDGGPLRHSGAGAIASGSGADGSGAAERGRHPVARPAEAAAAEGGPAASPEPLASREPPRSSRGEVSGGSATERPVRGRAATDALARGPAGPAWRTFAGAPPGGPAAGTALAAGAPVGPAGRAAPEGATRDPSSRHPGAAVAKGGLAPEGAGEPSRAFRTQPARDGDDAAGASATAVSWIARAGSAPASAEVERALASTGDALGRDVRAGSPGRSGTGPTAPGPVSGQGDKAAPAPGSSHGPFVDALGGERHDTAGAARLPTEAGPRGPSPSPPTAVRAAEAGGALGGPGSTPLSSPPATARETAAALVSRTTVLGRETHFAPVHRGPVDRTAMRAGLAPQSDGRGLPRAAGGAAAGGGADAGRSKAASAAAGSGGTPASDTRGAPDAVTVDPGRTTGRFRGAPARDVAAGLGRIVGGSPAGQTAGMAGRSPSEPDAGLIGRAAAPAASEALGSGSLSPGSPRAARDAPGGGPTAEGRASRDRAGVPQARAPAIGSASGHMGGPAGGRPGASADGALAAGMPHAAATGTDGSREGGPTTGWAPAASPSSGHAGGRAAAPPSSADVARRPVPSSASGVGVGAGEGARAVRDVRVPPAVGAATAPQSTGSGRAPAGVSGVGASSGPAKSDGVAPAAPASAAHADRLGLRDDTGIGAWSVTASRRGDRGAVEGLDRSSGAATPPTPDRAPPGAAADGAPRSSDGSRAPSGRPDAASAGGIARAGEGDPAPEGAGAATAAADTGGGRAGTAVRESLPSASLARIGDAMSAAAASIASSAGGGDTMADRNPVRILSLRLEPAELGTVTVRMRDRGGALEIELRASEPATARMIEDDGDLLRRLVERAGHEVERLRVDVAAQGPERTPATASTHADRPDTTARSEAGGGGQSGSSGAQAGGGGAQGQGNGGQSGDGPGGAREGADRRRTAPENARDDGAGPGGRLHGDRAGALWL